MNLDTRIPESEISVTVDIKELGKLYTKRLRDLLDSREIERLLENNQAFNDLITKKEAEALVYQIKKDDKDQGALIIRALDFEHYPDIGGDETKFTVGEIRVTEEGIGGHIYDQLTNLTVKDYEEAVQDVEYYIKNAH